MMIDKPPRIRSDSDDDSSDDEQRRPSRLPSLHKLFPEIMSPQTKHAAVQQQPMSPRSYSYSYSYPPVPPPPSAPPKWTHKTSSHPTSPVYYHAAPPPRSYPPPPPAAHARAPAQPSFSPYSWAPAPSSTPRTAPSRRPSAVHKVYQSRPASSSPHYAHSLPGSPSNPYALLPAAPRRHEMPSGYAPVDPSRAQYAQGPPSYSASSEGSDGDASDGDDQDAERRHVCPQCQKRFNRPSSLRTHLHTHTGLKPYRCPFPGCGRLFNVNSNMRRHYRTHDPDKLRARGRRRSAAEDDAAPAQQHARHTQHVTHAQHPHYSPHAYAQHAQLVAPPPPHAARPAHAYAAHFPRAAQSFAFSSVINPALG